MILLILVGGIGAFAPLSAVVHMTSIGTLLAFALVCAGVFILRYQQPEIHRPFRTPWVPFVPVAGILVCLMMMLSMEWNTWLRLFIWMIIGLMIYFYYGRFHR